MATKLSTKETEVYDSGKLRTVVFTALFFPEEETMGDEVTRSVYLVIAEGILGWGKGTSALSKVPAKAVPLKRGTLPPGVVIENR